tara:strand:- start:404 stop:592 length:189 start_codon:yes stop_codon:yes gene_type:complete
MAEDVRDDWSSMILHYIGAAFFAWLVLLVIAPQHTLLVTGVGVAWITGWIYKIDWTTVPWTP